MREDYPWKRFWFKRGDNPPINKKGFLYNPDKKYEKYFAKDIKTLSQLEEEFDCLILLGEPGIGKSNELESHFQNNADKKRSLFFELRDFDTTEYLRKEIFENEKFLKWCSRGGTFTLYLDSFDEGVLEIKPLESLLKKEITKHYREGLKLIITCRTATWPKTFEHSLIDIFIEKDSDSNVGIFLLAPLTESDVKISLEAEVIDKNNFLGQVWERDVGALASKPVTLKLLLKIFTSKGSLPVSVLEIYRQGCFELAKEDNPHRKNARYFGKLDASKRIAIAERMAAVTMLSNKSKFSLNESLQSSGNTTIYLNEISGDLEPLNDSAIFENVESAHIREILDTGLFNARGAEELGWSSLTFAEYLTSSFLQRRNFSIEQIKSLLFYEDELTKGIILA